MMVTECVCFKDVFKRFLKLAEEMELSLMFPSMLKDVGIKNMHGVELFPNTVNDVYDLFHAIIDLKHEISFGLRKNWFGKNKPSSNEDLAAKFYHMLEILTEATELAKHVHCKFDTTGNSFTNIKNSPHNERVVENLNFLDILNRFLEEMEKLELSVMIPSLFQDVRDKEIEHFIKTSSLGIPDSSSLLDVLQFLQDIKDRLVTPPKQQVNISNLINSKDVLSQFTEMHEVISRVVVLCTSTMQAYQVELSKSTGTNENIWNTDVNKSFSETEESSIFQIRKDISNLNRYQLTY